VRCSVLQCVAVCCSVVQCVTVHCSALQIATISTYIATNTKTHFQKQKWPVTKLTRGNKLYCLVHSTVTHWTNRQIKTETHCNTLQQIATPCKTMWRTATRCNTLQRRESPSLHEAMHCPDEAANQTCNTLQHAVTRCNTLQHTATRFNTLQHRMVPSQNEALHSPGEAVLVYHSRTAARLTTHHDTANNLVSAYRISHLQIYTPHQHLSQILSRVSWISSYVSQTLLYVSRTVTRLKMLYDTGISRLYMHINHTAYFKKIITSVVNFIMCHKLYYVCHELLPF